MRKLWAAGAAAGLVLTGCATTEALRDEPVDDFETHLLLAEFFLDSGDVGEDFGTDYTTVFYVC